MFLLLGFDHHRISNPNTVIPGLLWEGRTSLQIQQCPSFTGSANWLTDPYTGYNYNTSYIGHGQDESIPDPAKSSDVRHPAKTVLFGDGQYAAGADKFMRAPLPNPGDADFSGRWSPARKVSAPKSQQRRFLRRPRRIVVGLLHQQCGRREQRRPRHRISIVRQLHV